MLCFTLVFWCWCTTVVGLLGSWWQKLHSEAWHTVSIEWWSWPGEYQPPSFLPYYHSCLLPSVIRNSPLVVWPWSLWGITNIVQHSVFVECNCMLASRPKEGKGRESGNPPAGNIFLREERCHHVNYLIRIRRLLPRGARVRPLCPFPSVHTTMCQYFNIDFFLS